MPGIKHFKHENRWLSNYYPCALRFRGKLYPSIEYAYISAKSEEKEWKKMCGEARERQSKIKKKSQYLTFVPNREAIKNNVMRAYLELKFSEGAFKTRFLDTVDIHLQEGNAWDDTFWGVDPETGAWA